MPDDPYRTPHPQNVPGDFYVCDGCCVACEVPTIVAPDLFEFDEDEGVAQCFVKKQPRTDAELTRMFQVFEEQDVFCIRYRGVDPAVLSRINPTSCDAPRARPPRRWWQPWRRTRDL